MGQKKEAAESNSVEDLLEILASGDRFKRAEAARELCNMGMKASGALPSLLALYNDPCYLVRVQVPRAIIKMRPHPDAVIEILNHLLNDEDKIVRLHAMEAQEILFR
jgi:HEAT repeat protein